MAVKNTFKYVILILIFFASISTLYYKTYFPVQAPTSSGSEGVIARMAWYKTNAKDFDLVMLGDSRTYCGIHSFLIDPLLKSNSINLAQFSHWFPTQYPMIREIIPYIPKNTTVIWSIGHQNFIPSTGIQRVYPVGFRNALKYIAWRVPTLGLVDNLLFYNPLTHIIATRGDVRKRILDALDKPLQFTGIGLVSNAEASTEIPLPQSNGCVKEDLNCIGQAWKSDARFAGFYVPKENGKENSMIFYTSRGSYYRVELDGAFFRAKQAEMTQKWTDEQASKWSLPQADPGLWRLFEEILAEFKKNGVRVIVNELEEAPFVYPNRMIRKKYQDFMENEVKRRVEKEGFQYVRVDFNKLEDDNYFDYNHLNSKGSTEYASMLAKEIQPYFKK